MPDFLDFGKNTVFILACYGLSVLTVLGLAWFSLRHRAQARSLLREAEAKAKS